MGKSNKNAPKDCSTGDAVSIKWRNRHTKNLTIVLNRLMIATEVLFCHHEKLLAVLADSQSHDLSYESCDLTAH